MSRTMALLGLSVWIFASSRMTWRSRSTSLGSNVERKAMSARVCDGRLERIRGHHDVEVGVVEGRGGIRAAAHPFHRAVDVTRPPLVRALEEHVLLEVREAELIRLLVAHADAHVEVHGHDVGGAVILDDEPEPVREHLADGLLQLARG